MDAIPHLMACSGVLGCWLEHFNHVICIIFTIIIIIFTVIIFTIIIIYIYAKYVYVRIFMCMFVPAYMCVCACVHAHL